MFVNRISDYRAASFLQHLPHWTQILAMLLLLAWTSNVLVHALTKARWCNILTKAARAVADKPDNVCYAVSEGMGCS